MIILIMQITNVFIFRTQWSIAIIISYNSNAKFQYEFKLLCILNKKNICLLYCIFYLHSKFYNGGRDWWWAT